jgi:hypothetical protein
VKLRILNSWPSFLTLPVCICILLATAYILPLLLFPGFSVIDDGWNLQIADTLTETPVSGWSNILVETAIGRLRPFHYLYFYGVYLLAGAQPFLYWVGQWVVITATVLVMYKILFSVTKNSVISIAGMIVPFFFPAIPENLYRLGTQEPRQFLFELLFIVWALRLEKKNLTLLHAGLGSVLMILALGTKETSLILVPLFIAIYVLKLIQGSWRSPVFLALTVFLTLLGVGYYLLIPTATSYSLGYQPSAASMILTAYQIRLSHVHIFWLLGLAGCFTAVRLYFFSPSLQLKKLLSDHMVQLVILLATLGSIAIILPWNLQLVRYYYNVTLFMFMFITMEVAAWWSLRPQLKKLPHLQRLIICGALIILTIGMTRIIFQRVLPNYKHMLWETSGSMKGWFSGYQNNYVLIKYLMENTQENGSFYAAFADYEIVYDMGQYASLFGDRPIIIYNANAQMTKDFGFPYVYVDDPYEAYKNDPGPKILVDKATNPGLAELGTPVVDMVPFVTFYKAPKDLWSVTKSP